MNKAELINAINFATSDHTKKDIESILDTLALVITDRVKSGDKVTLHNIGIFSSVHKAKRKGRNPSTGAEVAIPAKNAVKFSPAKKFKDALN